MFLSPQDKDGSSSSAAILPTKGKKRGSSKQASVSLKKNTELLKHLDQSKKDAASADASGKPPPMLGNARILVTHVLSHLHSYAALLTALLLLCSVASVFYQRSVVIAGTSAYPSSPL